MSKGAFIIKITHVLTGHYILGATRNFSIYRRDMLKRLVNGSFRNTKFQSFFQDLSNVAFEVIEIVGQRDTSAVLEEILENHRRDPLCCNRQGRFALVRGPAVYRMTLPNGIYYIGSSGDLDKRMNTHRSSLRKKTHYNPVLQQNYTTWDSFEIAYTEHGSLEEALVAEQKLLDECYDDPLCCNLSSLADGSDSHRGKVRTPEHCANLSRALTGIPRKPRGT